MAVGGLAAAGADMDVVLLWEVVFGGFGGGALEGAGAGVAGIFTGAALGLGGLGIIAGAGALALEGLGGGVIGGLGAVGEFLGGIDFAAGGGGGFLGLAVDEGGSGATLAFALRGNGGRGGGL